MASICVFCSRQLKGYECCCGGNLVTLHSLRRKLQDQSRTSEEKNFHALVMTRSSDSPAKQP